MLTPHLMHAGAQSAEAPSRRTSAQVISIAITLVGILAMWVVLHRATLAAGAAVDFLNIPALAWTLVPPAILVLLICGPFEMFAAFRQLAGALSTVNREPSAGAPATLFQLWAALSLAAGFLATLAGLVQMLAGLDDPRRLGPSLAAALMHQLYGVALAAILLACSARVQRRYPSQTARSMSSAASAAALTLTAGAVTLLVAFGILLLGLGTY